MAGSGLLLALIALLLMAAVFPPGIRISPADGEKEINPDSRFLEISTSRWGASLSTIQVTEQQVAADGSRFGGRVLDGRLVDGRYLLANSSNPLQADAEYKVTVVGTVKTFGLGGVQDTPVEETHVFTTVTTPMPIISPQGFSVMYGKDAVIEWNIPVSSLEYELEGVQSTLKLEDGGQVTRISLDQFEQGKEYPFRLNSATSNNGRELKAPVVSSIRTPPPLTVAIEPADGTIGASIDARPAIVFSEPVSNAEQARSLFSIEPQVEGSFDWVEPNRLVFEPAAQWDHLLDVTVTLKGGPENLRGINGGFIESDVQSTFTTAPYKMIEVDIASQTVTLLENGHVVNTFLASTGSNGNDTPLGDYIIYAKIAKTDMRGTDYHVRDVPWVLVFMGDYTIHGNYWATAFGRPSSRGCVGLPVETAKYVYEWTPIGTPVRIY
ncbi:MAG: L,D-transpeptidase [Thermoleophilia bacterium]|nr:L,D-transpeptidase [Thermoleophilia bacterium]